MAVRQVTLERVGTVTLYKRRGNRSLRLSIGANGDVRVSMPYWLPYKAGADFAVSKALWIEAHRAKTPASGLAHGQRVGKAHRLYFEAHPAHTKITTRLRPAEVHVSYPASVPLHASAVQEAARLACIRALRKEAETLLPQRLDALSTRTGLSYNKVSVKQLKSRWGSCSSTKDITLNLFLMQLPWHLIDYVLLHELTHTKVMQHGTPFWMELEQHVPGAKQLRKQIAAHHPVLEGGL